LFGDTAFGLAGPNPVPAPTTLAARPAAASWPAPAFAPAPARAPAAALSPGQIPDDWNPFAPEPSAPLSAAPALATPFGGAINQSLGSGFDDSLDDLFGLGAAPKGGDPLGAAPQQALLLQPNMAAHADPLQSLGRAMSLSEVSLADHGSELNTPMSLPPVAPIPAPRPAPPAEPQASPASAPPAAIFSWDEPPRDGRVVTLPGMRRVEPLSAPQPIALAPETPAPAPAAPPRVAPAPASAAARQPAPHPAPAAGDDVLLAALLEGLGAPGLRIDALTPELMLLTGQLLRESLRGAVELLVARAALKREMRAEMTMIVARENNPLKFSPSVEVALQHLLSPPSPGFMPSAPAVRDAFNDLRAHQLGVMAGMKSALQGVLQRFDPQQLEAKLTHRSAISSLIPATRKARLWESFQQLFEQLSGEAQDDFDDLFGKAFLAAYEQQLDRLDREPGAR
jgi:type VI secretion system FHA domain protein